MLSVVEYQETLISCLDCGADRACCVTWSISPRGTLNHRINLGPDGHGGPLKEIIKSYLFVYIYIFIYIYIYLYIPVFVYIYGCQGLRFKVVINLETQTSSFTT